MMLVRERLGELERELERQEWREVWRELARELKLMGCRLG
jgi:hypothetical protein